METIRVRINDDGVTAREANHYGSTKSMSAILNVHGISKDELRIFDIDTSHIQIIRGQYHRYEPGERTASILPNGKIKILD